MYTYIVFIRQIYAFARSRYVFSEKEKTLELTARQPGNIRYVFDVSYNRYAFARSRGILSEKEKYPN